jgi:vacuolar-type H+-ATPase subunit H
MVRENDLNEKLIQQVVEIEERAQAIREAGRRQAERVPGQAQEEARALIEKTQAEAEEEARRLVSSAEAQEERARLLAEAEEEVRRLEAVAITHFDRAVGYVLDRVAGRERD